MSSSDDALAREAVRIYRRYQREFVEQLGVCPWAERARLEGSVVERVLLDPTPRIDPALREMAELAADETVEIGLLIFPQARLPRTSWERFVARLRDADAQTHPEGEVPMALAAFHPEATPAADSPGRLVPFLRRSPDPTVQLVRRAALSRVRSASEHGTGFVDPRKLDFANLVSATPPKPPLHERVAQINQEMIEREGLEALEALFADIQRDRDESYVKVRRRAAIS